MANWDENILSAADKISKGIEKGAEYIASKISQQPATQSTSSQVDKTNPRETKHCPSCGHTISSIDLFCPACGTSLEDTNASSAAQFLANSLSAIDSQREGVIRNLIRTAQDKMSEKAIQKAQMIKSFPVPNTKKDLLEFIHMAASSINVNVLLDAGNSNLDRDSLMSEKMLSETWLAKMESIYQKAKTLFSDDDDFSKIESVYSVKIAEIEKLKVELKRKKNKANIGFLIMAVVLVLILVAMNTSEIISKKGKTDGLEALVTEIRQDIADRNYNEALLKTNRIRLKDGSAEDEVKWDQTREKLIQEIENAKDGN